MLYVRLSLLLLLGGCWLGAHAAPVPQASRETPQQQGEKKPTVTVVRKVDPVYPQEAQDAGVSGKVVLEVVVETSGEVSLARVVNGHRLLNQAAIDAAKQWRFSNTYPDAVTLQLTFAFGDEESQAQDTDGKQGVQPTRKVEAVYPDEAKRERVQGEVVVAVTINEKGDVTEAHAESGEPLLRSAAVDAAKQFQFTNPLRQAVQAKLTFNFVLADKDNSAPKKPLR